MKLRNFLILAILFLFASNANAQYSTIAVQTDKTFYKASTVTDTSSTITVGSYPYVTLHTTSLGSDSSLLYANIDAYINGVWVNSIVRDTLTLGRPAGYILAGSTKGQVKYRHLRIAPLGTELYGGATAIRIRNIHASGSGDSNAALKYTQKIILKKVQ